MSGASPEPTPGREPPHESSAQARAEPSRSRPEHTGGALGTALCLLLVPALLLAIFSSQGRPIDGAALWAEHFDPARLPSGFEVVDAGQLPSGDRMVVVERTVPTDDGAAGGGAAGESSHPERLCLVVHARPEAVREAMQRGGGHRPGEGGGPGGPGSPGGGADGHGGDDDGGVETVSIQHGTVEWDDWSAAFVHHRAWQGRRGGEQGGDGEGPETDAPPSAAGGPASRRAGPARDTIRVNLSTEDRFTVLYATWPAGVEARADWMEDLLARLEYRPPGGGPGSRR